MEMQKHIDEIMDRFDFCKVQKAMQAVGWTYAHGQDKPLQVPDEARLRETARRLLEECAKDEGEGGRASGGFYANKFLAFDSFTEQEIFQLKLEFVFEYWETARNFISEHFEQKQEPAHD